MLFDHLYRVSLILSICLLVKISIEIAKHVFIRGISTFSLFVEVDCNLDINESEENSTCLSTLCSLFISLGSLPLNSVLSKSSIVSLERSIRISLRHVSCVLRPDTGSSAVGSI